MSSDLLRLNRVYWEYVQNNSYLRPEKNYLCSNLIPSIGVRVSAETFYEQGITFRAISQRLFDGANDYDIIYAAKYCQDRNIPHKVINLPLDKMMKHTIPDAVKHGQFTHSYSQIALCNLFNYIEDDEIIIFSGHNPDFHRQIGVGWWEDSPNIIKRQAIFYLYIA
jgi:hypothetical protein